MKDGLNELAKALVLAQAELKNPALDASNPHFRSKFASLAAIRNAVIPIMNRHGIFVTHKQGVTERGVRTSVVALHTSGEWVEFDPLDLPVAKDDAQGFGSACTYGRRYTLQAFAGIVGDDDDDGNAAAEAKPEPGSKRLVEQPEDPATGIADRFIKAANIGLEAPIWEIYEEVRVDHDVFLRVWSLIPSAERRIIKETIDKMKAEKNTPIQGAN